MPIGFKTCIVPGGIEFIRPWTERVYGIPPEQPVGIQCHIGRRTIAAFGNSDGDLQMLQWTASGSRSRFCLYVDHTDAEREYAYDRNSHIGKLDQGLDEAAAGGWTVVSMKDDWWRSFPSGVNKINRPSQRDIPVAGSPGLPPSFALANAFRRFTIIRRLAASIIHPPASSLHPP